MGILQIGGFNKGRSRYKGGSDRLGNSQTASPPEPGPPDGEYSQYD